MFDGKAYRLAWTRRHRAEQHRRKLISLGKCPLSEILLTSKYHDLDCPCGVRFGGYVLVTETVITIQPEHTQKVEEQQHT